MKERQRHHNINFLVEDTENYTVYEPIGYEDDFIMKLDKTSNTVFLMDNTGFSAWPKSWEYPTLKDAIDAMFEIL